MSEENTYIKALLVPRNNGKVQDRKVWSIGLESVWLPFFHVANVRGDTHVSLAALGAPLRLAYGADGAPKFGKTGRPTIRVDKELRDTSR